MDVYANMLVDKVSACVNKMTEWKELEVRKRKA